MVTVFDTACLAGFESHIRIIIYFHAPVFSKVSQLVTCQLLRSEVAAVTTSSQQAPPPTLWVNISLRGMHINKEKQLWTTEEEFYCTQSKEM